MCKQTMTYFGKSDTFACIDIDCSNIMQYNNIKETVTDSVVEAVRTDLLNRSKVGIEKYGVTLDRKDLNLRDWLQHAYEETLDYANYLKRAIMEIDDAAKK